MPYKDIFEKPSIQTITISDLRGHLSINKKGGHNLRIMKDNLWNCAFSLLKCHLFPLFTLLMVVLWKLCYRLIGKLAFGNHRNLQAKQIKMANLVGSLVFARHPFPSHTFWIKPRLNSYQYVKIKIYWANIHFTKTFNKHLLNT